MTVWNVWYGCHEESGSFGYYDTEAKALEVLAEAQKTIGKWTKFGDIIQEVGMAEITLNEPMRSPVLG
jgi:hypothetical protein